MEPIEVGFQAHVADGGEKFGAVRAVAPNEWSGHRPESMLRRYHIVDTWRDEAPAKMEVRGNEAMGMPITSFVAIMA